MADERPCASHSGDAPFGAAGYASVRTAREGAVALISLARPQARNALDRAMRAELRDAFGRAERDPCVRAVLVTGEGESFCAGGDIRDLDARRALDTAWSPDRIDTVVEASSKPVVGALHGHVLGGGIELALAFTLRVAADDLSCAFSEVGLGIFPGLGGSQRLPRIVGEAQAMEIILTGRTLDAEDARRMGLVTRVVPRTELREESMKLARRLAEGPPVASRIAIEAVRRAADFTRAEGLDFERRMFGIVCATEDKDEGIAAFRAKRRPRFKGR